MNRAEKILYGGVIVTVGAMAGAAIGAAITGAQGKTDDLVNIGQITGKVIENHLASHGVSLNSESLSNMAHKSAEVVYNAITSENSKHGPALQAIANNVKDTCVDNTKLALEQCVGIGKEMNKHHLEFKEIISDSRAPGMLPGAIGGGALTAALQHKYKDIVSFIKGENKGQERG